MEISYDLAHLYETIGKLYADQVAYVKRIAVLEAQIPAPVNQGDTSGGGVEQSTAKRPRRGSPEAASGPKSTPARGRL